MVWLPYVRCLDNYSDDTDFFTVPLHHYTFAVDALYIWLQAVVDVARNYWRL